MPDYAQKVAENRLRRVAARRGLRVRKSPRRDPMGEDYGLWDVTYSTAAPGNVFGDDSAIFGPSKFDDLLQWVEEEYDASP